ncbi:hypothetical protein D3C75_1224240 [compost metagenome]
MNPVVKLVQCLRRRSNFITVISEDYRRRTVRNGQVGYIIHGLLVDVIQVRNLTVAERIPQIIIFTFSYVIN